MVIGGRSFQTDSEVYVMGILNVTPDSFSDGGKYKTIDDILHRVDQMIREGVDIIDIGGESSRPGYTMISDEEEIDRVAGVIDKVKYKFNIPISLDSYKSTVAEAGIQVGADMINDIWGLKYDSKMAEVIAKHNVACCLTHNRRENQYENFLQEVTSDLTECINIAVKGGISIDRLIVDPGIGFGKDTKQNLLLLQNLEFLKYLGYPILVGASRKSVIGNTLQLPVGERLEGTIAISVLSAIKGCSFVRVHDVAANKRAIQMTQAILKA